MTSINKIISGCDYESANNKQLYFGTNRYNICGYLEEDKFNTIAYLRNLEEELDNIRENGSFRRGVSNHSEHFKQKQHYKYKKIHSSKHRCEDITDFITTLFIIIVIFGLIITTIKIIYELQSFNQNS